MLLAGYRGDRRGALRQLFLDNPALRTPDLADTPFAGAPGNQVIFASFASPRCPIYWYGCVGGCQFTNSSATGVCQKALSRSTSAAMPSRIGAVAGANICTWTVVCAGRAV